MIGVADKTFNIFSCSINRTPFEFITILIGGLSVMLKTKSMIAGIKKNRAAKLHIKQQLYLT